MKYYVEAYDISDKQILGNLDGQGVIRARDFRRTKHFKMLEAYPTLNNRVYLYRIVDEGGTVHETVLNMTHPVNKLRTSC